MKRSLFKKKQHVLFCFRCDAEHAGRRCEIYEVPLVKEFNKSGEFGMVCILLQCIRIKTCLCFCSVVLMNPIVFLSWLA